MISPALAAERAHLAGLIEAIQRGVYFLAASDQKRTWPLTAIVRSRIIAQNATAGGG